MGKALKPLAIIAGIGLQFIPGVGNAVGALLLGSGAAAMGGALLGTIAVGAFGAGLAIYGVSGGKRGGRSLSDFDPKSVNADPAAPRKLVLGRTAFPMDMRYAEPSGTNQEFIDYVFAVAAHKSDAIEQIYIEDDLAWTSGGGAQGKFAGYLTVEVILEAGASAYHTVNAGTIWNSTTRLTGCTTMKLRVKRSDNSKNSQSPFGSGLSGRIATIGRGMPVYDPAQDSTVAGGSGSQRAATNSTWAYTAGTTRGNNPALQLLSYLLGWKIGGVVSVGVGLPSNVLDLPSFATAAALCDESVALADGGSQRRYEAGRAFSDADDPMAVIAVLLAAMNGELVDDGGRIALRLAVNDLSPTVTLTDDDFVSGYEWRPAAPIDQQFTVVRGRYSQPDAPSLFGAVDYPEVAIARTSLAPRALTLELSAVQDQRRAERIAKQAAVRNLYQGTFTVTLGARGWLLRRNMVVAVTSYVRGWTTKLFRVRSLTFNADATVDVVLREENAAIYAWSASESAQVTPVAPVVFDSRAAASWLMADIAAGSTRNVARGTYDAGTAYERGDEVIFSGSSYRLIVASSTGNAPPDAARWVLIAAAGSGPAGADGLEGVTVIVTNEAHTVPTNADGSGGSYGSAGGTMILRRGAAVLTPTFSIAAQSPSTGWASIDSSTGVYTVTDPGATLATATLRATVGGVNYDRTYTLAQSRQGVAGPNVTLLADAQAFTYTDGAANPGSQTITLNALLTNLSGTATFSTTPSVTLGGSGNTRTLSLADFGSNRQVTVEATLGGITDRITLVRLERNVVAPNAANRVPFSRMEGNQGYGVLFNPSSLANVIEYSDFQGLRFFKTTATATAAGQQISIGNAPSSAPAFKLTPGERVSVQARVEVAGAAAASYVFALWGFEIDGVTQGVIGSVSGGVNYIGGGVVSFFVDVPAWARQGRLELYGYSSGAGSFQVAISEPMVSGAVAGQTLHPAFTPGPNAKDGADVTALNTAAAIAGQAWAATNGAQALVDNRLVPVGSNAVVNSDFTRGKFGFGWGGGGFESQWGVNLTGTPNWFGQRNVMWATVSGVLASGTERDLSPRTIWQGFPSADAPLFALPVVPNERLFASVLAAAHRCTFVLYILIFDAAFNLISAPGVVGGRSGGAANGDPANFDLLTVTGDVPANARWAIPMFRMSGTGGTDPYIFFTEPMFGKMAAGQTVVPAYVSGRVDLLADSTADALVTLRRGDWQSGVTYLRGQSVVRNRSSYVSLLDHSSSAGNGPPGANWGLVADGGVDGTNGTNGTNGANGTNGTNGTPGTNGIDGIDGIDGKLVEFIWRRAASVPATPTGNGIPAGWSDNPPAGSDPLWMSRGKQELDGTLIGTWSAPIRHDGPPGANGANGAAGATGATGPAGATGAPGATGATGAQGPTGVSAPPIKSLSTGAAQLDPIRLVSGQTVTAAAELYLNTGGVAGVCSLELQISEQGAGSWATMTSGTVTDSQPTSEAVELVITGATFTNSGANRLFDIRAVSVRRSRAVNVPPSFVRVV